ncbi:10558_t:CDS:2, partial [Racocetra fulgida]
TPSTFYDQHVTSPVNDISINGFIEPSYNYQFGLENDESELMNNNQDEVSDQNELFDTDSSDEENNMAPSGLYKGQSFQTWDEAEKYLEDYGREKGFSIRKKRSESITENGNKVMIRVNWECSCAGKYQPKKVLNPEKHRNRQSKATECMWKPIGRLLKSKFPGTKIYQKALYNAIQVAKKHSIKRIEFDASDLMRYLYSKCSEDSRWFVESRFDGPERRLSELIWLSPDQQ